MQSPLASQPLRKDLSGYFFRLNPNRARMLSRESLRADINGSQAR